jgi:hypothetical protein
MIPLISAISSTLILRPHRTIPSEKLSTIGLARFINFHPRHNIQIRASGLDQEKPVGAASRRDFWRLEAARTKDAKNTDTRGWVVDPPPGEGWRVMRRPKSGNHFAAGT